MPIYSHCLDVKFQSNDSFSFAFNYQSCCKRLDNIIGNEAFNRNINMHYKNLL